MLGVSARKLLILGFVVLAFPSSLFFMSPRGEMITRPRSTEGGTGIYRLEQQGGRVRYKNLNDYLTDDSNAQTTAQFDSTVIDLRSMSDTAYSKMYTYSQEVAVAGSSFLPPIVGDIDKDGKAELYGYLKPYTTPEFAIRAAVFAQDSSGVYGLAHTYPDSVISPLAIHDIDGDGVKELVQRTSSSESEVFRAQWAGMLPTIPSFGFNPFVGIAQMNRPTFGDFDNNGKTDVAYFITPSINQTFIAEYNQVSNTMDTVFSYNQPDIHAEGFSVGDFDQDGKTDIVEGSINGDVYVIEAQGVRQYAHVWTGTVETYNAYLHMKTNDIDGNGKPEFWVGGDAYYNGLGTTRFTCFESDGVHSYKPVCRIDLIGVFSFFAGNCFAKDINGDGKEELFICIDQHVIILKFIGSPNNHRYEIYYMKVNELADQNSVYLGATLYDLTGDGKNELLIAMDQVNTNQDRRIFTRIYKPANVDDVQEHGGEIPEGFKLFHNYPNPFNSSTAIRFVVPSGRGGGRVRLRIYDILGREIRKLLDEQEGAGEHEVHWDGNDNAGCVVGSGVYIIVMEAERITKSVKALFLK